MSRVCRPESVSHHAIARWSLLSHASLRGFFFHSLPAEFPWRKIDNSFSESFRLCTRAYDSVTLRPFRNWTTARYSPVGFLYMFVVMPSLSGLPGSIGFP